MSFGDRRKALRLSLFAVFCLYIGFSPYTFYGGLEFFPRKLDPARYPPAPPGVERQDVTFKTPGGEALCGWYYPVANARYAAVIHHGQGENIAYSGYADTARLLKDCGVSVLLYDYEGYGASSGLPSNAALERDGLAAHDFLVKTKGFAPERIVHCGISLGTGAACATACKTTVGGLILLSPYLALSDVAKHHLPALKFYPPLLYPQPDLGSRMLLAKNCKLPVLVLHGESDMIIPVSQSDRFCAEYKGPCAYIRLPGNYHIGGLTYGADRESDEKPGSALSICREFFKRLSRQTG